MMAYGITLLIIVIIASMIGLALNFQWGTAGLVNFGVVGFVAIGAYATALLTPQIGWLAGLAVASLICALLSMVLALLSMRLAEDYLAIVTLGFGEVVRLALLNEDWLTGGALGMANIQRPFQAAVSAQHGDLAFLAFALVLLAAVFVTLEVLVRSPFGRALRAVRDDAVVAASLAKRVLLLRVKAFAVGGVVMGIAGGLHAFYMTYIDPSQFTAIITSYAFMAVIAGGRGSNAGLLVGAGTVMFLLEGTRFLKDLVPALDGSQIAALRLGGVGVGIILLLLMRPQGLMREPQRKAASLFKNPQGSSLAADSPTVESKTADRAVDPTPRLHS